MPVYRYKALNEFGKRVKGEITAANEIDLEERLREVGIDLIDYSEAQARKASPFSRIRLNDMIVLCMHMEQLDRAGVPLLEALADVRDSSESEKLRDVLSDVYESVKGGDVLSEAMAKHPKVFNEVFVGLVAAGERTGNLSTTFAHLNHHLKWVSDIRRKIRKAMIYPATLLVVIIAVVTVLMLYVVPKLTDFMLSQGFVLPLHTRILIAVSDFFGEYWHLVLITPPVFIISLMTLYKIMPWFAYKFDAFVLWFPAIGTTVQKIDLARFTHFFGIMFRSGIDILDCLDGGRKVVSNLVLKDAIATLQRSVSEGNSLTESLRMSNQFPRLVVRMFKVGEDSGNMEEALENINFFYDREVNDAVDGLISLIQPTMTALLGGMVLWVVASVFGPLYETFGNMNF